MTTRCRQGLAHSQALDARTGALSGRLEIIADFAEPGIETALAGDASRPRCPSHDRAARRHALGTRGSPGQGAMRIAVGAGRAGRPQQAGHLRDDACCVGRSLEPACGKPSDGHLRTDTAGTYQIRPPQPGRRGGRAPAPVPPSRQPQLARARRHRARPDGVERLVLPADARLVTAPAPAEPATASWKTTHQLTRAPSAHPISVTHSDPRSLVKMGAGIPAVCEVTPSCSDKRR